MHKLPSLRAQRSNPGAARGALETLRAAPPGLLRLRLAMTSLARLALAAVVLASSLPTPAAATVRIKDIATIEGIRDNQLVGYGLVFGLEGTGDTLRNAPFTEQTMQSMLDRLGINVRNQALRSRNVAAVMVTAELPPFMNRGQRIDITVSSMGDASSLMGGTLVMTPLSGADGKVHAVAQGEVAVSGTAAVGQAESVNQGVPTVGRIPNGATIELPNNNRPGDVGPMALDLKNPDFATAIRIVDAINAYSLRRWGLRTARERDFRSVALTLPPHMGTTRYVAEIGALLVEPDTEARVIIDARTGTIVIGQDVQISTVAVTHGTLTVRVTETPVVSQPAPFSRGKTVVVPRTDVDINENGGQLRVVNGTTLRRLVAGLNQIGLKPSGIIAILQAIKSAGALQADLVTQ
ncbi:flagellar basal body P-ring protein [Beijerinckiaceae bacterium RH AL1]|nr:flagellar basal body P-ring protein [Beijerinckiaceae bacterium RH CH11]VVB47998.1 flagellar basal body P-ring protein [Beijerinckiaceae bacterium RH AL8]VVC56132.1 flagellar basal body P-ring protein [Beijerinckiaceae bacterium RH AL1]